MSKTDVEKLLLLISCVFDADVAKYITAGRQLPNPSNVSVYREETFHIITVFMCCMEKQMTNLPMMGLTWHLTLMSLNLIFFCQYVIYILLI